MNNPKLYNNYNQLQLRDASEAAEVFLKFLSESDDQLTLIDIGTGDGEVLKKVICKRLNLRLVVGTDKSVPMLDFAREHNKNENVKFLQMDVSKELKFVSEKFDIATSFYCLHWIQNLR